MAKQHTKLDMGIGIFFLVLIGAILLAVTYRVVRWIGGF